MQSSAKLILHLDNEQSQEYEIVKGSVLLGRDFDCDIVLPGGRVSRTHAQLELEESGWSIKDLGSANGTRINGKRIEKARLSQGDVINLGGNELHFETTGPSMPVETTRLDTIEDLESTLVQTNLETILNDVSRPRLVVRTPDKTWEVVLEQDSLTIGRDPGSDLPITDVGLSRRHARIERKNDEFRLRDLDSTNGTWIGGQRIEEHDLHDGEVIRIGEVQLVFRTGFELQELTLAEEPVRGRKRGLHPVVIVPGFMGSELWRGSERLWPNVRLMFSRSDIFRLPEFEPMEPRALVGEVVVVPNLIKQEQYNRLGDYLEEGLGYERGKDLLEFPYDWRQDVRISARLLGEAIKAWSAKSPVTIIAHSMGCLVSRYYVESLGGKEKVERLILLGGPHAGIPTAIESLYLGPAVLPFGIMGERLRDLLVSFPSMYQILPTHPCMYDQDMEPIDVLQDETWITDAQRPLLDAAREFRRELGKSSSVPSVSIFGYGIETITRFEVHRDLEGNWEEIKTIKEAVGDETIPETSAVLPGSDIHPVQQHHGALYVDNDVRMRLKLELSA